MSKSEYIVNKNIIKENLSNYLNLGNVCYSLKTNSNPKIIDLLNKLSEEKINFLINNFNQYKILKKMNIDDKKIYSINILDNELTKRLYDCGVRFFTFEDIDSIKKFEKYADTKCVDISIRLSINECFNTFTYMGNSSDNINKILEYVKGKYNNIGISFYLTEEIKHDEDSIQKILDFIKININSNYDFISIGGYLYNKNNKNIIHDFKSCTDKIFIESGTGLLNNAIDIKIPIIKNKIIENINIFIINNGIYSGFIDKLIYNKPFVFYIKDKKNKKYIDNNGNKKIFIYGASCDSKDYISTYYISNDLLEELKNRKYIYVENVGMYFEEFITKYDNDSKIKCREL